MFYHCINQFAILPRFLLILNSVSDLDFTGMPGVVYIFPVFSIASRYSITSPSLTITNLTTEYHNHSNSNVYTTLSPIFSPISNHLQYLRPQLRINPQISIALQPKNPNHTHTQNVHPATYQQVKIHWNFNTYHISTPILTYSSKLNIKM